MFIDTAQIYIKAGKEVYKRQGLFSAFSRGRTPAEEIDTLAAITLEDVNGALQNLLQEEYSATVIIRPAGEKKGELAS